ncbi:hypothetical protein AHF37_10927 [Paragonimus kellicotti]|nr:hypothetical protein AHF37_10927 [Paragonimus kellicotti]
MSSLRLVWMDRSQQISNMPILLFTRQNASFQWPNVTLIQQSISLIDVNS